MSEIREDGFYWDVPEEVAQALANDDVIYKCDDPSHGHDEEDVDGGVFHISNEWLDRYGQLNFTGWDATFTALEEVVRAELMLRDGKSTEALEHLECAQRVLNGKEKR